MAPAATMAPKSVENPKADFSPGQTTNDIMGKAEFNQTDLHTMLCALRLGNIKVDDENVVAELGISKIAWNRRWMRMKQKLNKIDLDMDGST